MFNFHAILLFIILFLLTSKIFVFIPNLLKFVDAVLQLHTRENWLKEARVVKQGEEAYKIVRGRPKRVCYSPLLMYNIILKPSCINLERY